MFTPVPRDDGHRDGRIVSPADGVVTDARQALSEVDVEGVGVNGDNWSPPEWRPAADCPKCLEGLPTEVLFHILEFLDIDDLLSMSRVSHASGRRKKMLPP